MAARQSTAGVVRERLAAFERRIANGVRLESLIDELTAEGFQVTYKTFRNALSLARRDRPVPPPTEYAAMGSPQSDRAIHAGKSLCKPGFVPPVSTDMSKDALF